MAGRYYEFIKDGTEYNLISVTTVLNILQKEALLPWAVKLCAEYLMKHVEELSGEITEKRADEILKESKRQHKKVSKEAMDIGTRTHAACEAWLKGQLVNLDDDTSSLFYAFRDWWVEHKCVLMKSEHTVYDTELGYAGTCDIVCYMDGKVYVMDIKTSNDFWVPDMPAQLAAYAHCVDGCEGIGIIRLDKSDNKAYWRDYTNVREPSWELFKNLLSANTLVSQIKGAMK